MYSILDFQAAGDGKTLNSQAIQSAIDACAADGGGRVTVPRGVFVTGTIWLRSRVELHLEHGAVLLGSPDLDDYNADDAVPGNQRSQAEEWNGSHLLIAYGIEDAAITGSGVIDGNGAAFFAEPEPFGGFCWPLGLALARDKERLRPGQMLYFCECRHVRVEGVTLRNSTCWTCFFVGCRDVAARGLRIFNPPYAGNTDGIGIDLCSGVTVSDCLIDTGDDAITLRGNLIRVKDQELVCENVAISNCVLGSSSSVIRFGVGTAPIRNCVLSNLVITRGTVGFHFMPNYNPAATTGCSISNITIANITARNLASPLVINSCGGVGEVRNVSIDNYRAEAFSGLVIKGGTSFRPENIALRNIDLHIKPCPLKLEKAEDYPSTLFRIESADGVRLEGVRAYFECPRGNWRHGFVTHDLNDFSTQDCRLEEAIADF